VSPFAYYLVSGWR